MPRTKTIAHIVVLHVTLAISNLVLGNIQTDIVNCRPQQVHLSYGETVSEMIVMWSTEGQCSTSVKYGTDQFSLSLETPGEMRMFSEPWNKQGVQYIHRVKLRSLAADTLFYYQPISNQVVAGPYFFKTPSSALDERHDGLQFLALGDLKSSSHVFSNLWAEASKGHYAGIIHPGNMALNLSSDGGKNGDMYMSLMEQAAKTVPYMTAPGPAECDNYTFSQYQHRFSMPSTEWPMSLDRMWYSVDVGLVHLVSYSTEVFHADRGKYAPGQHNWLINDLQVANSNRHKTPWIVAFGHSPMYCASEDPALGCNKQKSKTAHELEDLMYHYGVDVVISSYGQGFEVSYPMYKGVKVGGNYTNPLGPVHVTLGSASPWKAKHNYTQDEWLNFLDAEETPLKFGRLRVQNSSLLRFEIVSFKDLQVVHSFDILQHEHGKFSKEDLPTNISIKIDEKIRVSGGKPGVMNIDEATSPKPESTIESTIKEILHGDNRNSLIIGVSVAGAILLIIVVVLIVRRVMRGRRRQSSRRWENMDINYGKRYYNKAPDKDDLDQDFEIDMSETTPSRKLLSDD